MKIFANQIRNQAKAIVSKKKNLNSTVEKKSATNFGSLLREDFFYKKKISLEIIPWKIMKDISCPLQNSLIISIEYWKMWLASGFLVVKKEAAFWFYFANFFSLADSFSINRLVIHVIKAFNLDNTNTTVWAIFLVLICNLL